MAPAKVSHPPGIRARWQLRTLTDSLRWTHEIVALFSIVESCRKLGVPIRQYLAEVLPGLANRSIQALADLTPAACAAGLAK